MVEVKEISDSGQNKPASNTAYRGPGDDFPFVAFHILGATHILLAVGMLIAGIIHVSLGMEDRLFFLLSGGVAIWCPIPALVTGIIGAMVSNNRHWEVQCYKQAFLAMSLVTALLFMVPLGVVTGIIDFYFYQVAQMSFMDDLGFRTATKMDSRVALMWVIVALACLEFLVCILSACICCCCAPLYKEEVAAPDQQQQIIIRQQSPPPIYIEKPQPPQPKIIVQRPAPQPQPIYVQAPAPAQQQPIYVQAPAPAPAQQQPIYIQAPPQRPQAPIFVQAPPQRPPQPMMLQGPRANLPMIMPSSPMPMYAQPSMMGVRRTVRPVNRQVRGGIF